MRSTAYYSFNFQALSWGGQTVIRYFVKRSFTHTANLFFKQRQREGIESAKAQGKYTGRKPIEIDWTRFGHLYGEWKSKSITGRDFMRRMGLSANTFYRRVREYEAIHGIAEPVSALQRSQTKVNAPQSRPSLRNGKLTV